MRDHRHLITLSILCAWSMVSVLGTSALGVPIVPGAESPVADAAMRSDTEQVRSLLRAGADVNAPQGDGMTALHWAARNGDLATMQVLLYAGANGKSTTRLAGHTPLHLACSAGRGGAVAVLLEAGNDANTLTSTGLSPLHLAAEAGGSVAIKVLLEHGANINAKDSYSERTPLMFATARDRLSAITVLLEAGADVSLMTTVFDHLERSRTDQEERRRRELVVAAQRGIEPQQARSASTPQPPKSGQGTQAGAGTSSGQIGAKTDIPDPDDPVEVKRVVPLIVPRSLSNPELIGQQGGFTALHYAARDGRLEAARLLLGAGAEIDHRTGGDESSPMTVAIINGNFDLAMMLLELGANPNIATEDGAGPLFAVLNIEWSLRTFYPQPTAYQQQETSYLELMKALLEAGADPNARTRSHIWYAAYNSGRMGVTFAGATPFWRAAYATDVAAMRLLVEYGADPNISTIKLESSRRSVQSSSSPGTQKEELDPSGLPPVPPGGPHVHPLHAATGVGYATSRVGQTHRHVPDGWLPAVRYLVEELKVDVNVRDADGYSPVHNAAGRGDNEVVELLVAHGADVTVVSRRGQTTVDIANGPIQRIQPFPETIALLERLGAKNNHNCVSCD